MTPLIKGNVDVMTGWLTNTAALKVLGSDRVDLRLWDAGVRLYALPYYATLQTIHSRADILSDLSGRQEKDGNSPSTTGKKPWNC